jgi:aminopeptidase YwaD
MKRFVITMLAVVAGALIAGPGSGGDGDGRGADRRAVHPALAPFGVDAADLPAELYLVRSRGELPPLAGVEVHGKRDGVYLVSGERESVMALTRAQCAVFPIGDLPAAPPAPRVWTTITSPDPTIQLMVDQVNWLAISTKIQWLVDYGTRYSFAPNHEEVADGIAAVFAGIGLTPVKRSFVYEDSTMWNVEATQVGTVYPDSFIIICGHFDSISFMYPFLYAPGADDNGTGTATVLHAAEILTSYDFQYSIRYICFAGEEQILRGSQAYAQWAVDNNLGIVGVLNFDMLGYWVPGVEMDLEIETNEASQWLAAAILNANSLYVGAPYELHVFDGAWWGDHASFWDQGYAAVNHEEAWDWGDPDFNPNYHKTHDLIDYVGEDFMVGNVKIAVASMATLACLDTTATAVGDPVPPAPTASLNAYPNPFNDRVALTVTGVTGRDRVRVVIYDALGRRVGEVPVVLQDGQGMAYWNPAGAEGIQLTSGVYFGKIEGIPNTTPAKIVHIK